MMEFIRTRWKPGGGRDPGKPTCPRKEVGGWRGVGKPGPEWKQKRNP